MDLVSIIVPVYNVEQWLPRCVDSLIAQTYKNLEIILVDDGSADNSGKICDEYAEKDDRIVVIHKDNGGLSSARNAGLEVAKGNYISFVDSDDWVSLLFIENLYVALKENNCEISECNYVKTSGIDCQNDEFQPGIVVASSEVAVNSVIDDGVFSVIVCNKLYKKSLITVSFEEGRLHEDTFWTHQIVANCKQIVKINDCLYYYYQRENSIMGSSYSEKRLDAIVSAEYRVVFFEQYLSGKFLGKAQGKMIELCVYHSQLLLNSNLKNKTQLRKSLYQKAKQTGNKWRSCDEFSAKRKLWMNLYLLMPCLTCRIRNLLKIGV